VYGYLEDTSPAAVVPFLGVLGVVLAMSVRYLSSSLIDVKHYFNELTIS